MNARSPIRFRSSTKSLLQDGYSIRASQGQKQRISSVIQKKPPFRLAIIGSGPAGFYSAARVMSRIQDARIDMFEQLPVPFGLVRFGVAPDHPEVKNCQDKFSQVASSPQFRFVGNIEVGKDIHLSVLQQHYDAMLFAYGASKDRELGIPGENLDGIYSARAFVGWYNGLPEYAHLEPKLDTGRNAVIIGQGNVALDVARILLSPLDRLKRTDITQQALDVLGASTVQNVQIVGRRGPLQASFTIKEVRELMQLPGVGFSPIPDHILPAPHVKLPRAQSRMVQLLSKYSKGGPNPGKRAWSLDFLRAPTEFKSSISAPDRLDSVHFKATAYESGSNPLDPMSKVRQTNETTQTNTSLAFRSIGYKSEPLPGMEDLEISFDRKAGIIRNEAGRVVSNHGTHVPGLYCAGWVKRGPTGVIATTMEDAFATAELIVEDWTFGSSDRTFGSSDRRGWEAIRELASTNVDWQGWLKIDAAERAKGKLSGKEREKLRSVREMLGVAS